MNEPLSDKIRADFPALRQSRRLIYFDNGATTLKPKPVIDEVSSYLSDYGANIHRGVYRNAVLTTHKFEKARRITADFLNAGGEENIVFTQNTTHSINLTAFSLPFIQEIKDRKKILIPLSEHHSNILPWLRLIERGYVADFIKPDREGRLDMEDFYDKIDRNTALVSLSLITNVHGIINPVEQVIEKAHEMGSLVVVDGAGALPHMRIDLQKMPVDFFAFSGHKTLASPGIGVLYGRSRYLNQFQPLMTGGGMVEDVNTRGYVSLCAPHGLEAGTPGISAVISLGVAIKYIQKIGLENIAGHEEKLTAYFLEKYRKADYLDLYGPHDVRGRIPYFAFNLRNMDCFETAESLDKCAGIAVRAGNMCARPYVETLTGKGLVRASLAFYNTIGEIDIMFDALSELSGL